MAKVIRVPAFTGVEVPRGEKMRPGKAWRLVSPGGRGLKATLVKRLTIGQESIAIFRVVRAKD
jgi:hypothetical protein